MAYIDTAFYEQFTGETAPADFTALESLAALMIDALCGGKIGDTMTDHPAATAIKRATAAQLMYLKSVGGFKAVAEAASGSVQSASIGKFSYQSGDASGTSELIQGIGVSPLAIQLLAFTGLLYRGVDVCE